MKQVLNLLPNPKNPRKISDKKLSNLKKSILKFGDLSGIIFNIRSKMLVGGHQRLKVIPKNAQIIIEKKYDEPTKTGTVAEGYIEIDGERFSYREVDWDESTEKAANIAANKHGGDFEYTLLSEWLLELQKENMDMELVGFEQKELDSFFSTEREKAAAEAPPQEFIVSVFCQSEEQMEELFGEFQERGLECKIMS